MSPLWLSSRWAGSRWLSPLWLGLAASLSVRPGAASEPALAERTVRVEATPATLAMRGRWEGGTLVLWSCAEAEALGRCSSEPDPNTALRIEVGEKWLQRPVETKVERWPGGLALHLVARGEEPSGLAEPAHASSRGDAGASTQKGERRYHLVIVPGLRGQVDPARRAPRLALRGALSVDEHQLQLSKVGLEFSVRRRACGGDADPWVVTATRRLDVVEGSFVATPELPLPALHGGDLEAAPAGDALAVAVTPGPGSSERASESWVFGRGQPSAEPQVFSVLLGAEETTLRLALDGSSKVVAAIGAPGGSPSVEAKRPDASEWQSVSRVLFPPAAGDSAAFDIELPGAAHEARCVSLFVGAGGAVSRLARVVPTEKQLEASELVHRLGGPESTLYELALLAQAQASSVALSQEYRSLGPKGRARAARVIANLPDDLAINPLLAAAEAGGPEAAWALSALEARDATEVTARLEERLAASTPRDEVDVAKVFAQVAPEAAVRALLTKIDTRLSVERSKKARPERARRRNLRPVLKSALGRMAERRGRAELAQWTLGTLGQTNLGTLAKVELLRGLPRSVANPELGKATLALSGSFRDSYLLLEPLLVRFTELGSAEKLELSGRLAGRAPFSPTETAALQTRFLELLRELPLGEAALAELAPAARQALSSPERRVREQALRLLGERADSLPLAAPQLRRLLELSDEDEWLEVRVEAALALGRQLTQRPIAERAELEREVLRRLRRVREPRLGRAYATLLGLSGGPSARDGLLDILSDDDAFPGVRAEAALGLGKLCERRARPLLVAAALKLSERTSSEGQVEVGLGAVRALARLEGTRARTLLAPLFAESVPGPIRGEVQTLLLAQPALCTGK